MTSYGQKITNNELKITNNESIIFCNMKIETTVIKHNLRNDMCAPNKNTQWEIQKKSIKIRNFHGQDSVTLVENNTTVVKNENLQNDRKLESTFQSQTGKKTTKLENGVCLTKELERRNFRELQNVGVIYQ